MIPADAASLMYSLYALFAGALGVVAGGLICLLIRRRWGMKIALIDAAVAVAVAIIAAIAVSAIDDSRGVLEDRTALILAIAVAGVVVRHLIRLRVRSANQ